MYCLRLVAHSQMDSHQVATIFRRNRRLWVRSRNTGKGVYTTGETQIRLFGVDEDAKTRTCPRMFFVWDALDGTEWIRFASNEDKVAGFQTWWTGETQPSLLWQLHADVGTNLDALIIAGPEWGLHYFRRISLVSLEWLHVAFDADPKIVNPQ